ncbi:MAG: Rrf2 family transcriptional regulator [Sedimentisphaerales bacterium]|nr:Rrf2 family transcriptional regulator [Sedimentisphaerales bacterium]
MRISRSTSYAILALGYIAEHKEKKIVLSQDIARKYDIPLEYLLKLLQQLVKANILHSKRGPHGGFSLAKSPQNVTILQIIEAIEGPFVSHSNLFDQAAGEKIGAQVDKIYGKAIDQAKAVFQKAKLSTLIK